MPPKQLGIIIFSASVCFAGAGDECNVVIQRPNALFSKILINGKEWPEPGEEHPRPRYSVTFDYKGNTYFAIISGPYSIGNESEDVEIAECKTGRVVGGFAMIAYSTNKDTLKKVAFGDPEFLEPWDGRTWTPNFTKALLIEDWSGKEIPMTLDNPTGFFPDQQLTINIYKDPTTKTPWPTKATSSPSASMRKSNQKAKKPQSKPK